MCFETLDGRLGVFARVCVSFESWCFYLGNLVLVYSMGGTLR